MSSRKTLLVFGGCAIAFGGILAIVGFLLIEEYSPMAFDRSQAQEIIPGVRNELGLLIETRMENRRRRDRSAQSYREAMPFFIGGGISTIMGGVLLVLGYFSGDAKKPANSSGPQITYDTKAARKKYCPNCGEQYNPSALDKFCSACGQEFKT